MVHSGKQMQIQLQVFNNNNRELKTDWICLKLMKVTNVIRIDPVRIQVNRPTPKRNSGKSTGIRNQLTQSKPQMQMQILRKICPTFNLQFTVQEKATVCRRRKRILPKLRMFINHWTRTRLTLQWSPQLRDRWTPVIRLMKPKFMGQRAWRLAIRISFKIQNLPFLITIPRSL